MTDPETPLPDHAPDDAGEPGEAEAPTDETRYDQASDEQQQQVDAARLEDQLRHMAADLDNLRKRYQRDLARERYAERARVAAAWLPVVDNLELALRHVEDDGDQLGTGVRAVHEQAIATLANLGFPRFEALGQKFDPVLHEAVGTVDDQTRPGTVVEVVRPGYGTPEALLRPASVVVTRQ